MASNYVLGREKLRAVLAKLPKAAQEQLQQAMQESGDALAERQRELAPIGDTGQLRASIRVEPMTKGGIGVVVRAGGPTTTKPVKNGKSPSYDYAVGVELGTHDALAHPFFYPSYRMLKPKIKRRATIAVKDAVAQAVT